MNAMLEAREAGAKYLSVLQPFVAQELELVLTAKESVAKLRTLIVALAIRGRLVPQAAYEENAEVLLRAIQRDRERLGSGNLRGRTNTSAAADDREGPYALPTGWRWTSLARIGVINPRVEAPDDRTASFVQMSSIPVSYLEPHAVEPRPWRAIKSGFVQFAEGDVGVAKITPCFQNGKSTVFENLSNGIGAGTTELHVVRPLGGVVPRYILMFLKSADFLLRGETLMTGSAGQKRLPRSYFENCPFPLPPLQEQRRIVARVDELMRLCDALEAKGRLEAEEHARLLTTLLRTLTDSRSPEELAENWQRVTTHFDLLLDRPDAVDALEQTIVQLAVCGLLVPQQSGDEPAGKLLARIQSMSDVRKWAPDETPAGAEFQLPKGWEWARVDALADVQGGLQKTPMRRPVKNHFPYLRVANVQRDALDLREIERFELTDDELARWRLRDGDILIIEGNGSENEIGRCAVWNGAIDPCVYQNHLIRVRCPEGGCVEFVRLFLNSPSGRAEMKRLAITTSGLFNLSVGKIRNFVVPVPPLSEQHRIVARVAQLRRLCADLRERLAASQAVQARLADALVESATAA